MTSIWLIFLIGLLIVNTFLYYCLTRIKLPFASLNLNVVQESLNSDKFGNLLIVTAHPDDEIMFFGPSIVNWLKYTGRKVFIICLSSGKFNSLNL
jgi:N-acetylglucosaminylphosphatidylinositol deacetylase